MYGCTEINNTFICIRKIFYFLNLLYCFIRRYLKYFIINNDKLLNSEIKTNK